MSRRLCAFALGLCVGSSTLAAETLTLSHGLSMQLGHGPQDSALGANQEPFYGLRYEPVLAWHWPDRRWPRWQGVMRTWFNYTSSQTSLPFQEQQRREIEHGNAELREFYLRRQLLGDDPRFALTLGRQRYADPYGLWWDDSLESVRLDYRATFSSGFLAVGERFAYYNSDGNTLEPGDQDIRYAMGEFAWRWHRHHWAGVRGLFEDDHSDRSFDDATDFTGWRAGFFAHGTLPGVARSSDYRLETLALGGDLQYRAPGARTHTDNRRNGWALVAELGHSFPRANMAPRLSLRAGLTDSPDSPYDGFYFSRLQSGRVNAPGSYASGLLGSFVRVDLHNLAFYSLALETRPHLGQRFDVRVSTLSLRNPDAVAGQRTALPISVGPNVRPGTDRDLGRVLDLTYHWQRFPQALNGRHLNLELQANAGYFRAGDALQGLGDDFQFSFSAAVHY